MALLQAPRVPVLAEDLEMKKLINTYGKTFHTWQVDRGDTLPLGKPSSLPACPLYTHGLGMLALQTETLPGWYTGSAVHGQG